MRCATCGWALSESELVSSHRTSEGTVRYLRCPPCGRLAIKLDVPRHVDELDVTQVRRTRGMRAVEFVDSGPRPRFS